MNISKKNIHQKVLTVNAIVMLCLCSNWKVHQSCSLISFLLEKCSRFHTEHIYAESYRVNETALWVYVSDRLHLIDMLGSGQINEQNGMNPSITLTTQKYNHGQNKCQKRKQNEHELIRNILMLNLQFECEMCGWRNDSISSWKLSYGHCI